MSCPWQLLTDFVGSVAVVMDFSEKIQRRDVQLNHEEGYAKARQLVRPIVVALTTRQLDFAFIFHSCFLCSSYLKIKRKRFWNSSLTKKLPVLCHPSAQL